MGETGKLGTVVGVDGDGDPKVVIDGEEEVKQRFGSEFEIVEKKIKTKDDSSDDDKKKKKKKKKKSSSSSSSPSASSSSSSGKKKKKRSSAFGKSTLELQEEAKRKAKKYKKTKRSGADAALNLLGLG